MGLRQVVKSHEAEAIRTLLVWISFLFYGAAFLLPGSSLLDLQVVSQQNFVSISRIISMRSGGFLAGGILAGVISKYLDTKLIMVVSYLIFGFATIFTPLTDSLVLMEAYSLISGMSQATFDIAAHTYLFNIWKAKVINVIQILHMCFGVGGLAGPLIVRPFMLPLPKGIHELSSDENLDDLLLSSFKPDQVRVHWAFLIVGVLIVLVGIVLVSVYLHDKTKEKSDEKSTKEASEICKIDQQKSDVFREILVITICACTANAYFGCQILISGFTQAYGVKSTLHMAKRVAGLLAPSFWLTYVIGRLAFVVLSLIISEWKLITTFMSLTIISNIIVLIFAAHSKVFLFVFLVIFGFGSAPLFGLSLSLPSRYFHMSGRYTSSIFVSGIIGESIHAAIVSLFIDDEPLIFIYYLSCLAILFTFSSLALQYACKKFFKTKIQAKTSISASVNPEKLGKNIQPDVKTLPSQNVKN